MSNSWSIAAAIVVIGFLWWRLIDHLRVEWSLNPQYAYGWAVPFICAYLIWKRAGKAETNIQPSKNPSIQQPLAADLFGYTALACYFPTRLLQEANPEWRLVSWALALEVIAITLFLIGRLHLSRFTFHSSRFTFPLLFFLVAVPWPTVLESGLIQGLTRANVATTVELLGLAGIPALQHGNVIEVATGVVGIEEACSGIRSLQATLMMSLFFGEVYRLAGFRRVILCLSGFGLSFLCNVGRTTVLTWVAARKGSAALGNWHDPAGVSILLVCFLCLVVLAKVLGKGRRAMEEEDRGRGRERGEGGRGRGRGRRRGRKELAITIVVLLCAEAGTESWYRSHERQLAPPVTWTIRLPTENRTLHKVRQSERTRRLLRYDEAINATWEADDQRWQAIYFRWQPGRTAVHLAKGHTPEVCLTATGNEETSQSDLRLIRCQGLELPVRFYTFKAESGSLYVLYCLWRDRSPGAAFGTDVLSYWNRVEPVLTGTRLTGQRSLELAVWGCANEATAQAELERQLQELIVAGAPE